jgi:hypothetical protein
LWEGQLPPELPLPTYTRHESETGIIEIVHRLAS